LLVDGDEKIGVVSIEEALKLAHEKNTDLVEVAPLANPPVCKLMNFGTYLYDLKKKTKKSKKVKKTETKTIRLSIRTDKHDLDIKAKQARRFLEDRNMIKVVLIFHGREITHQDLAFQKINEFLKLIEDACVVEQAPKKQGLQMTMMLNPK
jgi:translation initiation factor IF-3